MLRKRLLLLLPLFFFIVSCTSPSNSGNDGSTPEESKAQMPLTGESDGKTYKVKINTLDGKSIPLGKYFELRVTISDKNDQLQKVTLKIDGQMPDHKHGMNSNPEVKEESKGKFLVKGMKFHMPGRWVIITDIKKGEKTEKATLEVHLD